MGEASQQRWNRDQISVMVLSIGRHWVSYNLCAGFAAAVFQAKVIAFGPHRCRALTMPVELAVPGQDHH